MEIEVTENRKALLRDMIENSRKQKDLEEAINEFLDEYGIENDAVNLFQVATEYYYGIRPVLEQKKRGTAGFLKWKGIQILGIQIKKIEKKRSWKKGNGRSLKRKWNWI